MAEMTAERGRMAAADAFAALADRHLDTAYRLACVILGDPTEAEDAAHDAAVLAWRRFGTLRDPERFEAWFCRIVTNVCRDRMRQHRRRPVFELPAGDDAPPVLADATGSLLDRDALDRAFARLDPDQRIVVVLRFYRDLSVDAIAERLGIPAGTVKSRLHNALRRLRSELERQGWREAPEAGGGGR